MQDLIGQQLGNYQVVGLLGRGGFAEVYLGEHIYLKSLTAVKVLHTVCTADQQAAFVKEAQMLARLRHPHIIHVLDFSVQAGTPFLVMDYAPGGSLRSLYPSGERVLLDTIVSYIQQIASALQYAHDLQIIHGDIKPENILLGAQQELLLSDFGLSIFARTPSAVDAPTRAGTLAYMAPEQLSGHLQQVSDQYMLGIITYEWICGQRPFESRSFAAALQERQSPLKPLRDYLPALSPEIESVVLRALARDPQQRFASIQDFAQAFVSAVQRVQSPPASSQSEAIFSYKAINPVITPLSELQQPLLELASDASVDITSLARHEENMVTSRSAVSDKRHWDLPPVFTPLVGREQEVKAAFTLLLRSDVRMLTFTGIGGIGKTRLAIQVATEVGATFADGVCFVSLASVNDPALVLSAIAHALGLQEDLDSSPQEQLQAYLRDRHVLLLLDNFEQVLAAAPMLNELLDGCPMVRLLVTSRELLHSAAEHEFSVHPLALPDLASLPTSEALTRVASVDLFLQGAQMVQPGFALTRANARAIATICVRLDGLPLALKLAAARVNLLPPQALLKRLEKRLSVLTSGTDGDLSRHQTLRSAIQWSYDLLRADEQRLFRRLALFVDGFTIHAAEALYTLLDGSGEDVLEGLSSLIGKNLIRSPEQDEEDPRLGMLETVRAFGLEALEASGEYEAVKRAYMQYFLALSEEASAHMPGLQEAEWKQRLEHDLANLRTAMQWSQAYGLQIQNMEIALRMGIALKSFWTSCGYFREGRSFLEQALAGCAGVVNAVQVDALLAVVHFAFLFCDYEQAQHMLEVCRTYYQEQNDTEQMAMITKRLGWLAHLQFRYAQAHVFYEEALILSRELHDEKMIDAVRYNLAFLALSEGDYQQSRVLLEESLAYRKANGAPGEIAAALGDMAQLRRTSSVVPPVEEMQRLLDEGMIYAREAGDRNIIMALRNGMAWVAFLRGNLDEAQQLVDETIAFYREAGKLQSLGHYLELLGRIYTAQGKYTEACATFEESVLQAKKQNDIDTLSSDLVELAHLAVEQRHYARAARLLGVDEKIRETASLSTPPFDSTHRDHAVTIASAVLGREIFELLRSEGRAMSPVEALAASDALPPIRRKSSSTRGLSYPAGLSRREVDVLCLVAQGFTDSQVAQQLVISTRTVTTHLTSIYNKLQINSRAAATNFAVKNHLV